MTGRKRGRADEEGSPQLDQAYIDLIKDPDYVELADGEILVGKKLIPFHSAMLGYRSKVLRVMLRGTDKDGWAAGFAKAFEGCKDNDVRLFFAIAHDSNIKVAIKALDRSNTLEGVAQIAHKLDTPAVISVRHILSTFGPLFELYYRAGSHIFKYFNVKTFYAGL